MVAVRELDPDALGERDLAGLHRVWVALAAEDHPGDPGPPTSVMTAALCHRPPSEPLRLWVAEADARAAGNGRGSEIVGCAWTELPRTGDNEALGTAEARVLPGSRRRGTGRRLLAEAVAACREDWRTVIDAEVRRGSDGVGFATALGYEERLVEVERRLDLGQVDRALVRAWAEGEHPGYSLVSWEDRCPDELLEAFAAVRLVMNDAPLEDFEMEDESSTPALVREQEEASAAVGRWRRAVCARHDASGELVGYTAVAMQPGEPWLVHQGGTAVERAHRGHGLGRWLKGEMASWLLEHRPEARVIETGNAGSNAHMVAINDAMGFRVDSEWGLWQAPLDLVESRL
ncbi:GNAT family N-acetyltransferase [soil metagenome]